MSYTTDALDKFAQALETTMAQSAPAALPGPSGLAPDPGQREPEPAGSVDADTMTSAMPPADQASAGVKPSLAERGQRIAARRDGITRKGPRGDWSRPVRVAVTVLAVGLAFRFLVGVSARAAECFLHQAVKQPSADPQHAHPKRSAQKHASVKARVLAKHAAARPHHRRRAGRRRVLSLRHHARG